MSLTAAGLKREMRPTLALALPVALGELGWMAMGIVDVMMVGRLGAEAIGAVSIGRALFWAVAVPGIGFLLGLDTLISQAFGAGDRADCHRSLLHGVYLSLAVTVPVTLVVLLCVPLFPAWGLDPEVAAGAGPYTRSVVSSALPIFLYTTFRRYLQAIHRVRPIVVALVTANGVNAFCNWVLIFGRLGVPALGVAGAGWATVISSVWLAGFLLGVILLHEREQRSGLATVPLRPDAERLKQLATLGLPAALQVGLEIGVFALATGLVGRLDAVSLAAHQIALTVASATFMVPLGISSAGAVRVGHALGRRDPGGAGDAGWAALVLGVGFMACAALVFLLLPRPLIRLFSTDPAVLAMGATLLAIAAAFQLFDGVQVVATGNLRGTGDTRTPMLWNLIGHWAIGLPIGTWLGFAAGWGAVGIWIGLCTGLMLVGLVLLRAWSRRVRRMGAVVVAGNRAE